MRLVLDPNVLIAAFVARGQCHEVLEHAARAHHLLASKSRQAKPGEGGSHG